GGINEKTCFIELTCTNFGALVMRDEENKTSANVRRGRFFTTIHEYNAAIDLGLIDNVRFHSFIDNEQLSNFENFILPLYEKRLKTKELLAEFKRQCIAQGAEYDEAKREDIFVKLLLNNA